ncbi:MAG TPA: hypothetical protein VLX68_11630 [Chitinivibrionales bacterium]|nr:hypothetical protein [Chitinivibrionales bacterium]
MLIFSKDRACQLDSLLRSIRDHFKTAYASITVLYKATGSEFEKGYDVVKRNPAIEKQSWIAEKSFQNDVRAICGNLDTESLVMFLVDDDIMFRPCAIDNVLNAFSDEHLFISLRASRTYAGDTPPEFIIHGPYLEWKWNYSKRRWVTWNYPFSVDGNIYHVKHIQKIIKKIVFEAPNSFEGRMHTHRHHWWVKRIKKALAPIGASVFNNPLNRVQAESKTWHGDVSAESLNAAFLSGMRIDNSALYRATPGATHFGMGITFVKEQE